MAVDQETLPAAAAPPSEGSAAAVRKPAKSETQPGATVEEASAESIGDVRGGRIESPQLDFYQTLGNFAGSLVRFFIGPVAGGGHAIECSVEAEEGDEPRLVEAKAGRVKVDPQDLIDKFEGMAVRWQIQRVE